MSTPELHMNGHSSISLPAREGNNPNFHQLMDKQSMTCPCGGLLLKCSHYRMDGPWEQAQCKKPGTKGHLLYDVTQYT